MASFCSAAAATTFTLRKSFSELLHSVRSWRASEAQLLIQKVSLKDSVTWVAENRQEHSADDTREDADNNSRWNRIVNSNNIRVVHHEEVAASGIDNDDASDADNVENGANWVCSTEPVSILDNEGKGEPGRDTEVIASAGDLDVGILGHILDTLVHEPEDIWSDSEKDLGQFARDGLLDFLSIPLEQEADHLANGNNEGAKSDRADVILEEPLHACPCCATAFRVEFALEIPEHGRAANDELRAADNEGIDPEEHENLEEENVSGHFAPLDFSCESVREIARCRGTSGEREDRATEPDNGPDTSQKEANEWQNEYLGITLNKLRSSLEDGNTNLDCIAAA